MVYLTPNAFMIDNKDCERSFMIGFKARTMKNREIFDANGKIDYPIKDENFGITDQGNKSRVRVHIKKVEYYP